MLVSGLAGLAHPTHKLHHGQSAVSLLAPKYGCKSKSNMATDEFCVVGCANVPPNCPDDLCQCPEGAASALSVAGRPDIKAPVPRIIGGWTNCGPDSGVEEWYATHGSDPSLAGRRLICHTLTCAPRFGQAGEVGAES